MTDFENEVIKKIENILLDGKSFDYDRKEILLDFKNSFQVQACPGSGKTTLLVAKLMFLAQTIDFSKEPICILTHTNVAVDEIKRKIKKHNKPGYEDFVNKVYKLFDYPNYVGTIQSFLDKYLGIPGYIKEYGFKPHVIDDDRVLSYIKKEFFSLENGTRKYLNGRKSNNDIGIEKIFLTSFINGKLELSSKFGKKPPGEKSPTYNKILEIKKEQIEEYKYLKFKEIDYFSLKHLEKSKNIKSLLQKRFKYIFLDEIQDTHSLHIKILNKLYEGGNNIIQGFGDENQEIFDDGIDGGNFTIFGDEEPKQINNSLRLSSIIAENVKNVCIKPRDLKGISGRNIPIYFIIFNKPEDVISKYLEIIEKHKDCFVGIEKDDLIFKAVGWVQDEKENGKFGILNYRKNYNNGKITKGKANLFAYFQKVDEKEFKNKGYSIYKDNIISGILHSFNQNKDNQIKTIEGKYFSKTKFIDYLKVNYFYFDFQKNIFKFANDIENETLNWEEVKNYILNLEINGKKIKDDNFLKNDIFGTPEKISNISTDNKNTENVIQIGEIKTHIQFATIAKVKGETHTGTLVLDTDFHEQNLGKILDFWNNSSDKNTEGPRNKKGLKNHYVAITRATHLLCIAINKNRDNISLIDSICYGKIIKKI